jgi:hypothetical protein
MDNQAFYNKLREYIGGYEMDTGEGIIVPNEHERFLLEMFVLDLINDDSGDADFITICAKGQQVFPYTKTFNAIAEATKIQRNLAMGISVIKFEEAFNK